MMSMPVKKNHYYLLSLLIRPQRELGYETGLTYPTQISGLRLGEAKGSHRS